MLSARAIAKHLLQNVSAFSLEVHGMNLAPWVGSASIQASLLRRKAFCSERNECPAEDKGTTRSQ